MSSLIMIVLIFGLESAPLSVIFKIIEELTEDTSSVINTLRLRQNGRHFTDDIFKCIFLNETVWVPIKISLVCSQGLN